MHKKSKTNDFKYYQANDKETVKKRYIRYDYNYLACLLPCKKGVDNSN